MFDAHAHIEDYLLGKLDAKKKTQFEEALKKDKVLQKIVEDYATYVPVADHFIYQDLKQLVRKERKLLNRKKIVLSILGLAGLGFLILLFSIFNKPKHEKDQFAKLFEKHYNSPMLDQERGSENNSTKDLCHEAHIELDKLETTIAKRLFDAALTEYKPNEFCSNAHFCQAKKYKRGLRIL